jgi:hypothetical protein
LHTYVEQIVAPSVTRLAPETPLFWSVWGRRSIGMHRAPMTGKNIWRLCKLYGRLIGYPMLKPHDIRHGVAMEVLEQRHDLGRQRARATTSVRCAVEGGHSKTIRRRDGVGSRSPRSVTQSLGELPFGAPCEEGRPLHLPTGRRYDHSEWTRPIWYARNI